MLFLTRTLRIFPGRLKRASIAQGSLRLSLKARNKTATKFRLTALLGYR